MGYDAQPGRRLSAADQLGVRRHNLSMVLRRLRDEGPRSRAGIAAETGLNKATVSSLVAELTDRALVRDGTAERSSMGRPGQPVELDGRHVCGIGIAVDADALTALVLNFRGDEVSRSRVPLPARSLGPDGVLDRLAELVAECHDRVAAGPGVPAGLTIAVPGLVESHTGVVAVAPNLGWRSVPLADELSGRLGQPTYPLRVGNAANLAALAEYSVADPADRDELLLLTGDTGIGGGAVTGGRLLRGARGFSGEVGHLPLDPAGLPCACGARGCWQTVVGMKALLTAAADPDDPVCDPALGRDERVAELVRRAEAGDARTIGAIERVGAWLGTGAAILVSMLNPHVLVLGGYFSAVGRWLTGPLTRELHARVLAPGAGGCRVQLSTLGSGAAVLGGARTALDAVFDDPTLVPKTAPEPSPDGRAVLAPGGPS
ncbi:ROK family transcriptional regulator [Allonocardiopsis opalescens]|uniref:Putative NBD/HSP70 family sugar kinase n=1 Tax=Allonocardiopsis opalescens TaxID=1144618 RepID=A0A2T0QCP5_9ACTN|nr:ROK family transcriptional regulator [Allonocardiopsis opalescens]PRY01726.1 putative NBD/HSP70 family sugar kinase [Allonocardiopsis opalescens]